jgi:DNA-binding IclR family transcriptional regulator
MELLEIVARVGEIGISELAREVGLAVSTTHSLVRTLARRHYLVGVAGRYRLGLAVTMLTASSDPVASLGQAVQPALNRLADISGRAATATVLVGREAKKIGFVPAPGPVTATAADLGWTEPLHLATGRVLVALTRESEWTTFIAQSPDAEPSWPRRRWLNELRAIQRTGIAVKPAKRQSGAVGVAIPFWSHGGAVAGSIGCSAPAFLAREPADQPTLAALWTVSTELSGELGCEDIPLPPPTALLH